MRDQEKAVIFISHDLDELMDICDTLTVLRDGSLVATIDKADFSAQTIKRQMVGRETGLKYYREDYGRSISQEVVLDIDTITTASGTPDELLHAASPG